MNAALAALAALSLAGLVGALISQRQRARELTRLDALLAERDQRIEQLQQRAADAQAEVAALKRQLSGKGELAKPAAKRPAARSSKREHEEDAVVRRAKPATSVSARKTVVRSGARTRK